MAEDLMNDRLSSTSSKPKTGEELETLGKEAASKYVRGGVSSLTEAVVETVKSAGLSPEQVKRVVEFTNIDAFHQEFRKEGMGHKVVEFEGGPADYSQVIKDLNSGGHTMEIDKHAFDYSTPPPNVPSLRSLNEDRLHLENTKLAEAFGVDEIPLPYAEPLREAIDMKDKLAGIEQELATQLSQLEGQYFDVIGDLFDSVKQASLGGVELGQIVQAWSTVASKPQFIKAAFAQLTPRLLENGVFSSKSDIGDSIMKMASAGIVNQDHPLVINFCDFCETLTKLAETRVAHTDVAAGLDTIVTFLKAASLPGALEKGWNMATSAAREAAPIAGGAVEKAVPYAPHAALGYAALRTMASQPVQKGLAYVPGTQQNQARQYYAQQQGY
jgi:hypothetical protein